jgi:hypothetical protein
VRRSPLITATVATFVLGAGLLFAFEKAVTIAAGIILLFAFLMLGVFAVASPEYLTGAARDSELPPNGSSQSGDGVR